MAFRKQGEIIDNKLYVRFNAFHRWVHFLMMTTFTGLVVTGLPLKFYNAGWAQWVMDVLGGVKSAGIQHRICAIITFGYFFAEVLWIIYCKFVVKMPVFTGPTTTFLRMKDVHDVRDNVKYMLGLGPEPKFDRFTYWEKFDYLVVFWGVPVIGLSGLVLWFPGFATNVLKLPGIAFNMAHIMHSDEALLATLFIFVVHLYNTHLRPERFPLDPVIFTGTVPLEEMKHDRLIEYERVMKERSIGPETGGESSPRSSF